MSIVQLTKDDCEAVVTQLKTGKTIKEVATDLQISVEMATCAVRKWPELSRSRPIFRLF